MKKMIGLFVIAIAIVFLVIKLDTYEKVFPTENRDIWEYINKTDYLYSLYDVYNDEYSIIGQDAVSIYREDDKEMILEKLNNVSFKDVDDEVDWRYLKMKYYITIPSELTRKGTIVRVMEYEKDFLLIIAMPDGKMLSQYVIDKSDPLIESLEKLYIEHGFDVWKSVYNKAKVMDNGLSKFHKNELVIKTFF